jgi:hypothetical protein
MLFRCKQTLHPLFFKPISGCLDSVRWGISISLARSPAVSWKRTRGRICSYSSCGIATTPTAESVPIRRCARGDGVLVKASPFAFPQQRCFFQAYLSYFALQGFGRFLARLDAQCLPACSPQLHAVIYEEVSSKNASHVRFFMKSGCLCLISSSLISP